MRDDGPRRDRVFASWLRPRPHSRTWGSGQETTLDQHFYSEAAIGIEPLYGALQAPRSITKPLVSAAKLVHVGPQVTKKWADSSVPVYFSASRSHFHWRAQGRRV